MTEQERENLLEELRKDKKRTWAPYGIRISHLSLISSASEEIERTTWGIAAVFEVSDWTVKQEHRRYRFDGRCKRGRFVRVDWGNNKSIDISSPTVIVVGVGQQLPLMGLDESRWNDYGGVMRIADSESNYVMVCGLYRLGVEDEHALANLPQLNNHEKLELRLSLPREFWPRTWLDEEEPKEAVKAKRDESGGSLTYKA